MLFLPKDWLLQIDFNKDIFSRVHKLIKQLPHGYLVDHSICFCGKYSLPEIFYLQQSEEVWITAMSFLPILGKT